VDPAVVLGLGRLARVAAPGDRPDHLGAEPEDVAAVELGDGDGQQAAGLVPAIAGGRAGGRQRLGGEDVVAGLAAQPVGDPADLLLGGRGADQRASAVVDDRGAAGLDEVEQDVGLADEPLDEVVPLRHPRQEPGLRGLAADPVLELGPPGLRGDLEREHLAHQVARRPDVEGDEVGRPVVAGDQPPEPPLLQDRGRHRRPRPHVDHGLDVGRRDAPERGEAQVERPAGRRVERRDERDRGVSRVGDQPQAVGPIQGAGLRGDVGLGEPQAEVGGEDVVAVLRDHRAVPPLVEAVDQDAVDPGDPPDLDGGEPAGRDDVGRLVEPGQEVADHRVEVAEQGAPARPDLAGSRTGTPPERWTIASNARPPPSSTRDVPR